MVKGVNDGPRISQDFGNTGVQNTKAEKTPYKPMSLGELNAKLGDLGLPTFGSGSETPVRRGSAEQTPRQDGAIRNRSEGVKTFFKAIGEGVSSFFAKIGNAFKTGVEAIKQLVSNRVGEQATVTATAETPKPPVLDRQGGVLKDFCEDMTKLMEAEYQEYKNTTTDDPQLTCSEFVTQMFPDPPGGREGIDPQSSSYIGDRLDDVRANLSVPKDDDKRDMQNAVMDRLAEMPTLDIATTGLFSRELKTFDKQASTFLRGNSAYTRLDKFIANQSIPFEQVAKTALDTVEELITTDGHLGVVDGEAIGSSRMNKDQAEAAFRICDTLLDQLLDTDPNNEGSLYNSISGDYREFLSEKAEQILERPGETTHEERDGANKMMYANSIFLRGVVGYLMDGVGKREDVSEQRFVGVSMNIMQSFMNGAGQGFINRANPESAEVMRNIIEKHAPRFEAFMLAVGRPTLDQGQDLENVD